MSARRVLELLPVRALDDGIERSVKLNHDEIKVSTLQNKSIRQRKAEPKVEDLVNKERIFTKRSFITPIPPRFAPKGRPPHRRPAPQVANQRTASHDETTASPQRGSSAVTSRRASTEQRALSKSYSRRCSAEMSGPAEYDDAAAKERLKKGAETMYHKDQELQRLLSTASSRLRRGLGQNWTPDFPTELDFFDFFDEQLIRSPSPPSRFLPKRPESVQAVHSAREELPERPATTDGVPLKVVSTGHKGSLIERSSIPWSPLLEHVKVTRPRSAPGCTVRRAGSSRMGSKAKTRQGMRTAVFRARSKALTEEQLAEEEALRQQREAAAREAAEIKAHLQIMESHTQCRRALTLWREFESPDFADWLTEDAMSMAGKRHIRRREEQGILVRDEAASLKEDPEEAAMLRPPTQQHTDPLWGC